MIKAWLIEDSLIRTTPNFTTTSFFKNLKKGCAVDVIDSAVSLRNIAVANVRLSDGTEGWIDWNKLTCEKGTVHHYDVKY